MKLNELKPNEGAVKARMRVGRGLGSGKGKTAGRGTKGQKARTGVALKGFEGGQMPLFRRLPKRGFNNIFARNLAELSLVNLQEALDSKKLDSKKPVDHAALVAAGMASRSTDGFRLIGGGVLKTKVDVSAEGATKSAKAAVEKLGGKVTILKREKVAGKKAAKKDAKKKKTKGAEEEE